MRTLCLVVGCFVLAFTAAGIPLRSSRVQAGTALEMELPALVERADLILEADVLSATSSEQGAMIETEYLLRVERTFHGEDRPFRRVRMPGGVLEDGRGMVLAGMPRLVPGESALLFLSEQGATGVRMPVGLAQGKYAIVRTASGAKQLVQDQTELTLVTPGGGLVRGEGRSVRSYAEVLAEVEAALAAKQNR